MYCALYYSRYSRRNSENSHVHGRRTTEDSSCLQPRYTAYDRCAFVLCKYTVSFGLRARATTCPVYNVLDNRHNGPAVTASAS